MGSGGLCLQLGLALTFHELQGAQKSIGQWAEASTVAQKLTRFSQVSLFTEETRDHPGGPQGLGQCSGAGYDLEVLRQEARIHRWRCLEARGTGRGTQDSSIGR